MALWPPHCFAGIKLSGCIFRDTPILTLSTAWGPRATERQHMKIAILSDIHANLEAFQAVLEDIRSLEIAHTISFGDMVGYGPNPEEVIQLVRSCGVHCTMGNHELGIAVRKERQWFNPSARKGLTITERLMSRESLDYIARLPRSHFRPDWCGVHGFPPDSLTTYLFEMDLDRLTSWFSAFAWPVTFVGHTHELELVAWDGTSAERRPLIRETVVLEKEKYIVNVGSVGQPRDGDNSAKYIVWDPDRKQITVRFVPYDYQATAQKIINRGFPRYYATRLG